MNCIGWRLIHLRKERGKKMKWLVKADCLVDEGFVTWNVDANSPEEAEEKGYQLARKSSVADIGTIDVEPLEEDKQLICDKLLAVLQITRNLYDLIELQYNPEKEIVVAGFANGYTKTANVALDSGTSMIRDIIRQIL